MSQVFLTVWKDCFVLTKCPTPCRLDAPCWGITTWYNHNNCLDAWGACSGPLRITDINHEHFSCHCFSKAFLLPFKFRQQQWIFVWDETKCELNTGQRPHTFPLINRPDGFAEEDNCFIFSRSFSLMLKLIVSSQLICRPEKRNRTSHVNIEFK